MAQVGADGLGGGEGCDVILGGICVSGLDGGVSVTLVVVGEGWFGSS